MRHVLQMESLCSLTVDKEKVVESGGSIVEEVKEISAEISEDTSEGESAAIKVKRYFR